MDSFQNPPLAYRVPEFFAAVRISRSKGYALLREGRGPRVTYIDGVPVITAEDGQAWLRAQSSANDLTPAPKPNAEAD